jgi:SAM-dependent methyltransferase
VLQDHFPKWRQRTIHESSPAGSSSKKIADECQNYSFSHFFIDTPTGTTKDGIRCENIEKMTFADASFDLFVTQDVFEHVFHPDLGFKEIARVLKPGGAHIFTIPWYYWKKTKARATEENGNIIHLMEPIYHGNPIDSKGSLVVTEWGYEFANYIAKHSGLATTIIRIYNPHHGIDAKFIEVFISYKI